MSSSSCFSCGVPAEVWGTPVRMQQQPPEASEDAPPSPLPRSMVLINQCSQLCTVPSSIPWSYLVSALEGHICIGSNGLQGYPCMCFPSRRPFPTSLSSDVTIPGPETMGRDRGSPWHSTCRTGPSLPLLHVTGGSITRPHHLGTYFHEFGFYFSRTTTWEF